MGCFSFKCLECGRGVRSSSFDGEKVHLFLLKKGKVLQKMTGEYDSYGRVFIPNTENKESYYWDQITPFTTEELEKIKIIGEEHTTWHQVCDLLNSTNIKDGIAAIHVSCYKGTPPKFRSVRDPDQGWGGVKKKIKNYNALKEIKKEVFDEQLFRLVGVVNHDKFMYLSDKIMKKPKKLVEIRKKQYINSRSKLYRIKNKLKELTNEN